jgi:hypothetical protein
LPAVDWICGACKSCHHEDLPLRIPTLGNHPVLLVRSRWRRAPANS